MEDDTRESSSSDGLLAAFDELPWALRRDLAAYVSLIRSSTREIFAKARVPYKRQLRDEFLFLVALQKVRIQLTAHAEVLNRTVTGLERYQPPGADGSAGLQIGRTVYTRESQAFIEALRLRQDLDRLLKRHGALSLIAGRTHSDIAREVYERHGR